MNAYKKFGYYYDEIMQDINYELFMELVEPYININSKILDLACGSGTFCILLKLLGYNSTGLDLSSTILEIAKEKSKINHLKIPYHCQDMINFRLEEKYDLITCFFDSINFISSLLDLNKLFESVYLHLNSNGYFIFDIFSYKMFLSYQNNTLSSDYETFKINWITLKDSETSLIHDIEIKEDDELYKETYREYYYDYKDIKPKGFNIIKIIGDFNDDLQEDDEHIFFILQKKTNYTICIISF